jgi:hypothetical protein
LLIHRGAGVPLAGTRLEATAKLVGIEQRQRLSLKGLEAVVLLDIIAPGAFVKEPAFRN